MSWDRDLYLDTFHNVTKFTAEGLPVETRWNSHVSALGSEDVYWLDPKGKEFGPNAKFFRHDIAEAKKLLSAAGYPNGFDVQATQVAGPELPSARSAEVVNAFANEIGVRTKVNSVDYLKEYISRYRNSQGQFEGWAYGTDVGGAPIGHVVSTLAQSYWSKGDAAPYKGFSISGKNDRSGDPLLDAMIEKARLELDSERVRSLAFDIQRYLAKAMYQILPPGGATSFRMTWPCVRNYLAFLHPSSQYYHYRVWIDETQPPLKSV
jgi:ABC-type transport system substrate-binding protein